MANITKNPTTVIDDDAIGTVLWTSPNLASVCDSSNASASLTSGKITHYLQATNFGFSIPANARIDGIVATVNKKASATNAVSDYSVMLYVNNSYQGNNKAITTTKWGKTAVNVNYGSSTDTWGLTLTPSIINSSNFGLGFSATSSGSASAYIDCIKITVYYTLPSINENEQISENTILLYNKIKTATSTIYLSENTRKVGFLKKIISQIEQISENTNKIIKSIVNATTKIISSTLDISENTKKKLSITRIETEIENISENITKNSFVLKVISSSMQLFENTQKNKFLLKIIYEIEKITHIQIKMIAIRRLIANTLSIVEQKSKSLFMKRTTIEDIQINENIKKSSFLTRIVKSIMDILENTKANEFKILLQIINNTINLTEKITSHFGAIVLLKTKIQLKKLANIELEIQKLYNAKFTLNKKNIIEFVIKYKNITIAKTNKILIKFGVKK